MTFYIVQFGHFSSKGDFILRKIKIIATILIFVIITFYFTNRTTDVDNKIVSSPVAKEVYSYWKKNSAELNRFELNQVRYGEIHKGQAVMIFVTEPFLPKTQVKYDGLTTNEKKVEVLKLNFQKNFYTGIYPYSIMTSVFTPFVSTPQFSYKVTTSSQDWCGQSFFQLNKRNESYVAKIFSYFQSQGDKEINIEQALLEDEVWNRIRLNYQNLPVGEIEIIPSSQYVRLMHVELKTYKAEAKLGTVNNPEFSDEEIFDYSITYYDIKREFHYLFEKEFPHKIIGWKETYIPLAFTGIKEPMTTSAKLVKSIRLDYWNKNKNEHDGLRREFGVFEIK